MTNDKPAVIVNVSLASSERDYDKRVTFLEHEFQIVRIGTDGDVAAAEALVHEWADAADAIAVTGIREARAAGLYDGELEAVDKVKQAATPGVPVTDGHALRDVLQEWAIRHLQTEMPGYFNNARTVVLGGLNHSRTTRILREFTENLEFADPLLGSTSPRRSTRFRSSASRRTPACGRSGTCRARSSRRSRHPATRSATRWHPQGGAHRRRRRRDLRRAGRLRAGGPGREDRGHLRDLRRPAGRAGRPWRRPGARLHTPALRGHRHHGRPRGADAGHRVQHRAA